MNRQIPTKKRMQEIEENHNRDAIQTNEIVTCPKCKNEQIRFMGAGEIGSPAEGKKFFECPKCYNSWSQL